jgi:YVTN family beta-propeller protein
MFIREKSSNIFIIILFIAISCHTATHVPPSLQQQSRRPRLSKNYIFMLQPYTRTSVALNGKKIRPTILYRDKTMAKVSIPIPGSITKKTVTLTLTKRGYSPFTRKIDLTAARLPQPEAIPLFVLDKKEHSHSFYSAYKTGKQPKSVRFINNTTLAVPLLNDHGIDIINIHNGPIKRILPPASFASQKGFVESIVIEDEDELWISQMTTNSTHVFSLYTFAYKRTIAASGSWCKFLLENPYKETVLLSNWDSQDISIIDKNSYREIKHIDAGGIPRGLCLSPEGKYLYICQYGHWNDTDANGQILKVDMQTMNTLKSFGKPGAKRHIVLDNTRARLFVSDMAHAQIEVYTIDNDRLIKTIKVYSHPNTITLTPDHRYLYVSCRGKNNPKSYLRKGYTMGRIYVIDTRTLKVIEYWEGGNQCTGLDVSPNGEYIAFSDFLDHTVRVYKRK